MPNVRMLLLKLPRDFNAGLRKTAIPFHLSRFLEEGVTAAKIL